MKRLKAITIVLLLLANAGIQRLWAQNTQEMQTVPVQGWDSKRVSPEAAALFNKYAPKKDSLNLQFGKAKHSALDQLSFHFNLLDWALTMPGIGLEWDLDKNSKNNKSISIFGKGNIRTNHKVNPRLVFDVASVRAEFRKYWRTGGIGTKNYNYHFEKIQYKDPKLLKRDSVFYNPDIWANDTIEVEYYANAKDSALHKSFNGDPSRSRFYNMYLAFRRNVTSTRTIKNPRNWRAYYVGAYAGWDKFDVLFRNKGYKGQGINLGISAGFSIPLLTREHPSEGGLDLDLGGLLGIKVAKFDKYHPVTSVASNGDINREYVNESAEKAKWTFVKYPIVHELRVSLVYRMRSIKHKVSLALVDDYQAQIDKFKEYVRDTRDKMARDKDSLNSVRWENNRLAHLAADSASYWDNWHKRRLTNARRINPDTVFVGKDDTLYQKIFRGIDLEHMNQKQLEKYHDSIDNAKKMVEKMIQKQKDSIANEIRIAEKKAKTDSLVAEKLLKKQQDSIANVARVAEKKAKADSLAAEKKAKADSIVAEKMSKAEAKVKEAQNAATEVSEEAEKAAAEKKAKAEANLSDEKKAAKAKAEQLKKEAEEKKRQAAEEKAKAKEEAAAKKAAEKKAKEEEAAAKKKAKEEAAAAKKAENDK